METWEHQFHVGRTEDDEAGVDVDVDVDAGVDVEEVVAFAYTTQYRACKVGHWETSTIQNDETFVRKKKDTHVVRRPGHLGTRHLTRHGWRGRRHPSRWM